MSENFYLYLLIVILAAIFGIYIIRVILSLRNLEEMERKIKGNSIAISKLRGELKTGVQAAVIQPDITQALQLNDLSNLTLEQAAASLGIEEELKNPIARGLAEGIFNKIKERAATGQNENIQDEGY